MAREILRMDGARNLPKSQLTPCNVCELEPVDCGQQTLVRRDNRQVEILCGLGKGNVERINVGFLQEGI